jgi:hypothetical protein
MMLLTIRTEPLWVYIGAWNMWIAETYVIGKES